jgi:hypothetical protein
MALAVAAPQAAMAQDTGGSTERVAGHEHGQDHGRSHERHDRRGRHQHGHKGGHRGGHRGGGHGGPSGHRRHDDNSGKGGQH